MGNTMLDPEKLALEAGEKTREYKHRGYHCSEAVVRAVTQTLGITVGEDFVKGACGFFGGAGGSGGRCGIAEVGIMLISLLYGRATPFESEARVKKLTKCWLNAFEAEIGALDCRDIKPGQVALYGEKIGCEETYAKGAALLVRFIANAEAYLNEKA